MNKPKLEEVTKNSASLKFRIIPYSMAPRLSNESFIVQDIMPYARNQIIEIVSLTSTTKGDGKALLLDFCNQYDCPVVLKAEPMYKTAEEYEKAVKAGGFEESLAKLIAYYEHCHFISINFYVGYENGEAFIFENETGKSIYQILKGETK